MADLARSRRHHVVTHGRSCTFANATSSTTLFDIVRDELTGEDEDQSQGFRCQQSVTDLLNSIAIRSQHELQSVWDFEILMSEFRYGLIELDCHTFATACDLVATHSYTIL